MDRCLQGLHIIEHSADFSAGASISMDLGDVLRILPGRREVYRAQFRDSGVEVVTKCYLPHAKQARDWRREWAGLLGLYAKGLPVPKPLAVARTEEGVVCVIMACIAGANTLGAYLEQADEGAREQSMQALARLVDRLHLAGARQMDQHIDNWAIADGSLYLLDAGTYVLSEHALAPKDRLEDLAAICATLTPEAECCFRAALRASYALSLAVSERDALIEADLSRAIERVQQARVRRYFKKTLRACTEFAVLESARWTGMYSNFADSAVLEKFLKDPELCMAEGERLKSGNTCTVQGFAMNDRNYVIKRYNKKKWWVQVRRSLFPSRARQSWSNAWVLDLSFIPTARPVGYAEARGFPRGRSYLLMEQIDGVLLPDYVDRFEGDTAKMERLIAEVGQVWDLLGRMRASHGDLKATNWMVGADEKVYLFDLDSLRFGLSGAAYQRGRDKDRKRFLKNWETKTGLLDAFRQRLGKGAS